MTPTMRYILCSLLIIFAYLVGAINFAIVFSKIKKTDIKKVGSGNPGTMNVLRSVGKIWGVLTFLCDALKGLIFALIGLYVMKSTEWMFILGLITIIGHIFPVYTKFKGGKGVATSIGVFLVTSPIVGACVLVALIVFLLFVKYGFIGSILCIGALCAYNIYKYVDSVTAIVSCCIVFVIVVISHRSNITRLIRGEENTLNIVGKNKVKNLDKKEEDSTDFGGVEEDEKINDINSHTRQIEV